MSNTICPKCDKNGILVLEKERSKQRRRSKRSTNIQHKEYYDTTGRPRGRYYKICHTSYVDGKRKLTWHYLGNFEFNLERLIRIKEILEEYSSVKRPDPEGNTLLADLYNDRFFVWEESHLDYIKEVIKKAKNINKFKKNLDEYTWIIWETIKQSQFYIIRGKIIYKKYD